MIPCYSVKVLLKMVVAILRLYWFLPEKNALYKKYGKLNGNKVFTSALLKNS